MGGLGQLHQPAQFADQAAQRLTELLGFTSITRGADQVVTASTPDNVPGYILTRFADKYGRCVAFVFPGASPHTDLSSVFVSNSQDLWMKIFRPLPVGVPRRAVRRVCR